MKVLEIVELNYYYIILKTEKKVQAKLRYTIPLTVPIIPDNPFELEIAGIAVDVEWNEKENFCKFKLVNLDIEDLLIDKNDVFEEIVDWWCSNPDNLFQISDSYLWNDKYKKYREIKEKLDLLRLYKAKPYNRRLI